ncbi:hypothetical protein HZA86_02670 [Candidatus Uhrbacteria bacterium]|nr:hypothetical protein [Candidatus Uhrbacteria bacterium]
MTNSSVPFDPDFDGTPSTPSSSHTPNRGVFGALSAKQTFIVGVLTTFGIACAIGFFVLLKMMLQI